jgi:alpha-tubulin suppressor-like RCC1 family protein
MYMATTGITFTGGLSILGGLVIFGQTPVTPGAALYAWGRNNAGQLGVGDTVNRSSPIQVGLLNTWTNISAGYVFDIATLA